MKRIFTIFLLFVAIFIVVFCVSGCNANSVHLATESEIKMYVQKTFGDAIYLRKEVREDNNCIIYHFKDAQLEFEYYVGTYASSVGMDGSTFWYQETKNDNFYSKYSVAILDKVGGSQLPDGAFFELAKYWSGANDTIWAYVNLSEDIDLNKAIQSLSEFSSRLTAIDTRRILKNQEIVIKYDGDWLGRYKIYENEYVPEIIATYDYYNTRAEEIMGITEISINGSKSMSQSDVPYLSNEHIAHILGSDYNIVTCYYFSMGDTKYFIADACVMYGDKPMQYIYNITENRSMVTDFS